MKLDTDWLWKGYQRISTWPAGECITVKFDNSFVSLTNLTTNTKEERWNDPNNELDSNDWEYYYIENGQFLTSKDKSNIKCTTNLQSNLLYISSINKDMYTGVYYG